MSHDKDSAREKGRFWDRVYWTSAAVLTVLIGVFSEYTLAYSNIYSPLEPFQYVCLGAMGVVLCLLWISYLKGD